MQEYNGKELNKNTSTLDLALRFLKEDKVSVFPVAKDKKPLIQWKEFQTKLPTQKRLKELWAQYPEAQIGIATGKLSNLTVVDIEAGGDWSYLPQDTLIVKTGGGGRHYYFQYHEGLGNKTRLKELTDIRSEGGYVVAPGSVSDKGSYEYINIAPPKPFPKELFDFDVLRNKENFLTKVKNTKPVEKSIPKTDSPVSKPISIGATGPINIFEVDSAKPKSLAEELVDMYPGFAPGQRNQAMAQFVGLVLSKVHPSEWDTLGKAIIWDANDKNEPALSDYELNAVFRSISTREAVQLTQQGAPEKVSLFSTPPKSDQLISTGDDEVKHIAEVAREQKLDQTDIYPLEMPCFDDVTLGGICPGDLVVIAGKTGEGKSSLAMDWTLSMIRGKRKAPVLWFSYELLPTHLWAKFEKMGMTEEDVAVIPAKHSSGNVAWVEGKIKEAKEKFGVKVIVIDHLGFLLPKIQNVFGRNMSSNYATYLTQITREIKTLAVSEEVAIILPVHMRKTEKVDMDAIKDSVGISQESDLVFLIERERDKKKAAKAYYTDYTKITLSKNRKTGITVSSWFKMFNERFIYDTDKNNMEDEKNKDIDDADEKFDKFNEKEIGPVASSPVNKFGYEPRAYEDSTDKKEEKISEVVEETEEDIFKRVLGK